MKNDLSLLGAESRRFVFAEHGMFIDGMSAPASSGGTIPVFDPSSGEQIAAVPEGTAEDVDRAVQAAKRAFGDPSWAGLKPAARERLILKLALVLEGHAQEFSEIESLNSGRLLVNTRLFDVDLSVDCLRYMAGWTTKLHGKTIPVSVPYAPDMDFFAYTTREPVGVVGAITPWNVPLGQAIWKIAPVLATGCTVVLKPAENTPLTALRFALLAKEVGIPDGVINVVTGYGAVAGAALVAHPDVSKISFTGSTDTGRAIGIEAARSFKKCSLELGGKSPVIILDDADLSQAIPGAAQAILGNHGQNCCAGSRLFVHESIYDEVLAGVAEIASSVKLGPGLAPSSEMGPLVSSVQQQRVLGYIKSGIDEGAEVVVGNKSVDHPGFYVRPTILANVTPDMKAVREEIFGPVLAVASFKDTEEAIARANDTSFGLGASVWTTNINKVHRMVPRLEAGMTWVNTHNVLDIAVPFGGIKNSGIGVELSEEAILQHTNIKSTIVNVE
ncbi:aldehyde dehydrogenase family protein [Kineobactrum salinum]|uniref:Aldehyde dehydrogenase family protein n=1 Tax=Kineobactrum salinum TaxID=2708301 RepID=A0A6C0TZI2_9GAMM|nr:aldehyde dehydrogenase family protein [Kineobactrum salinum]QIB64943.1 aldehyde dehydrogenase family protein [Kineobactrum salinum]